MKFVQQSQLLVNVIIILILTKSYLYSKLLKNSF
jgi:hypothetical protein